MKYALFLVTASAFAACKPAANNDSARENVIASATPVSAGQAHAAPPTKSFEFGEENDLLDFSYSYPAEAAGMPPLVRQLQADMMNIKAEALGFAADDRDSAAEMPRPFHGHYLHKGWTTAGDSQRLLSLAAMSESFTGGAHGNTGFSALLWDREANRAISLTSLFQDPVRLEQLTRTPYCRALDAERLKRRDGEVWEGQFSDCPKMSELAIVPSDEDGNRRFDHVRFLAGPYVAGPYAEGEYEISLPFLPELLTALKPEYRASFEAQPQ